MQVLQDISVQAREQQFVSILGPSGCGKSTLFEIISGLLKPDRGGIEIDGLDFLGKTGRVSYMPQKNLLLPWMNIIDNVSLPLMLKGKTWQEARKHALQYFEVFGLEGFEKSYPVQLSGGMKQRAALLRTYLFASDIMLLDEPFGALDAITRNKMHMWLLDIWEKYRPTVLFITHDIDEAIFLSDKIYVLTERPAQVKKEIDVDLPRPRTKKTLTTPAFLLFKEEILSIL
jgi:ABC-type nitrate/sulfonate/bicarbonate transport system ATPase subunit